MTTTIQCPTCKTPVIWQPESVFRPFCSERCKLIDLGDWAAENHRIPDKMPIDAALSEAYLAELEQEMIAQDNQFFKNTD
ncbi:DNA gyrase inhibitor YacG [Rheinheimera sp. UJ51]|uniref:DNA gyrase inhibitor YacG n=1 Tax=Rheinheimera sp. UJ51 TaxID=2892446 RepID=UPI001E3A3E37|nr:DNA gyrase inhibitor YacG [Rheinheimera sp. UJ51]MCC5450766.1 DNA gyrase inhibitor YacG [Rheinheimera sp. UJ51]